MKHFLWRVACAGIIFVTGVCAGIMTEMFRRTTVHCGRIAEIVDSKDDDDSATTGRVIRLEHMDGSMALYDLSDSPNPLVRRERVDELKPGKFYRVKVNAFGDVIAIKHAKVAPEFKEPKK